MHQAAVSLTCESSINGQDARAEGIHLPFLRKAEKAIANESWSQISRFPLAIACADNRGLPKPAQEEDDKAGNETGKSETGAGTDRC